MPKSAGAKKVMAEMIGEYGPKKGKQVYYATANKQGRDERTFKKTGSKPKAKAKKSDSKGHYNDGGGGKIASNMRHHMHKNKLWRG